jgi:hypothetical protein
MAENKKSFVLDKNWIEEIEKLTDEQAGILFKSILEFVNGHEPLIQDLVVRGCYYAISEQIVFEWTKFNPKNLKYHWNYQGGITPQNKVERNSTKMNIWRLDVFKRDDYSCKVCNKRGGVLNAHHIKHFSTHPNLRTELSNGITLCKKCHTDIHKKEREVKNG